MNIFRTLWMEPANAWLMIEKEPIRGALSAIFSVLGPFFLLWYAIMAVGAGLGEDDMADVVRIALFLPGLYVILYAFFLWALSAAIFELAQIMRLHPLRENANRIAIYSALPFLTGVLFYQIPFIGKFFAFTAFMYQFYLIYLGVLHLIRLPGPRKTVYFITLYTVVFFILILTMVFFKLVSTRI